MRTAFAMLCSCVLLALGVSLTPATAGDDYYGRNSYYGPDSYYGGRANVWYSSNCCYRRIVRHVSVVQYVPTEPYRRYGYYGGGYRYGYYGRPYRYGYYGRPYGGGYYGRPYRYGYYGGGYRYGGGYYVGRGYGGYSGVSHYDDGYDAYNAAYSAKTKHCATQRARVPDGRGGWIWGVKKICG
jgi:hypothetical protein